MDAWFDKEKLLPGQDWELEIKKAVREADVVVVCLSKQFNQAGFRQKEVRLALDTAMEKPEGEIFIIPARLEECDTLESLRKWHWVDLFEDDGYEMLMRALRARADKIGTTLNIKGALSKEKPESHGKKRRAIRASIPNLMFWTRGIILTLLSLTVSYFLGWGAGSIGYNYFSDSNDTLALLLAIPTWFMGLAVTIWLGRRVIWIRK